MARLIAAAFAVLILGSSPLAAPQKVHVAGHTTKKGTYVQAHDKIQRSAAARHAFARQTGYPHGRPGYVIDHIVPLACGGKDEPANMQWQSVAEAKEKDKWERTGCRP